MVLRWSFALTRKGLEDVFKEVLGTSSGRRFGDVFKKVVRTSSGRRLDDVLKKRSSRLPFQSNLRRHYVSWVRYLTNGAWAGGSR